MYTDYSVLMSVYYKEKPLYLEQAMDSIWKQTMQTNDFVLVCTDLVERYADDPEQRRRYLELIRISGKYLLERCEQLRKTASQPDNNAADLEEYFRTHADSTSRAGYDFTGKRILIVDDMELNREIAGEIIRESGAETVFCGDGLECVTMIESSPAGFFDLILMDLSMPVMDGIQATEHIRSLNDSIKSKIPVIAMTANVSDNDRKMAYDAGMNGFAEKPIDTDALYELLQQNL